MLVFICIATTANGLIDAGIPHDQWISDASWQSYLERLKTAEVAILGSKTYDVMGDTEFMPNVQYIVLTHDTTKQLRPNIQASQELPKQLIERLVNEGRKTIAILGGAEVISDYLEAGVVDELHIDIAGTLSGKGKNLLLNTVGVHKLEIIAVKQLDQHTVQLRYKITN